MTTPSILPWPEHTQWSGETVRMDGYAVSAPAALDWLTRTLPKGDWPLVITCRQSEHTLPLPGDDEGYTLAITSEGATLDAAHWRGVAHGLTTLHQLGSALPLGTIADAPRFPWRGIKLDCVRHFIGLETIKRILDGMAFAKLNVLHWGLSNYQGFRVESHRFPRLHTHASNGRFYTQAEVRELIGYAARRGIRVVPEFNMPGHSTAFLVACPELAAHEPPTAPYHRFSIIDDVMDPTKDEVFAFIHEFVEEFASLFPDSHWHMGGDEVMGKYWDENPAIQAYMKAEGLADNAALQARFTDRYAAIVRKADKVPIGWEEVVRGAPDPDGLMVESWIGSDDCSAYETISATGFYLDHFLTAADHYRIDPQAYGTQGGEAAVWTEAMMDETVENYIWPRAGAIAERLWSPEDTTNETDLYRRLSVFDAGLEARGARHHQARALVLDRAAGGKADDQWAVLASGLRPTAYYFLRWEGYDCATPADRLVQALDPDPPAARRFNQGVEDYLATGTGRGSLEAGLNNWLGAARSVPLRDEDKPIAEAMAALCELGIGLLRGTPGLDLSLLARTEPAFPKSALVPDILEAIFRVFGEEDRPLALKQMNLAIWPGVKALADAGESD